MPRNIIEIQLHGGFGNQLWQLAFAHDLQNYYGSAVKIHVVNRYRSTNEMILSLSKNCKHLKFQFGGSVTIRREVYNRIAYHRSSGIRRYQALDILSGTFVPEKASLIGKSVSGYFQNYASFSSEALDQIREEIWNWTNNHQFHGWRKDLMQRNVIHIRRADYLDPLHLTTIGALSDNYFVRAKRQLEGSDFIILTNDKLSIRDPSLLSNEIFDQNALTTFESFLVLQQSNSLVLSNSSFSWWANFTNENLAGSGKSVFPKPWFRNLAHEDSNFFCWGRQLDSEFIS